MSYQLLTILPGPDIHLALIWGTRAFVISCGLLLLRLMLIPLQGDLFKKSLPGTDIEVGWPVGFLLFAGSLMLAIGVFVQLHPGTPMPNPQSIMVSRPVFEAWTYFGLLIALPPIRSFLHQAPKLWTGGSSFKLHKLECTFYCLIALVAGLAYLPYALEFMFG